MVAYDFCECLKCVLGIGVGGGLDLRLCKGQGHVLNTDWLKGWDLSVSADQVITTRLARLKQPSISLNKVWVVHACLLGL